MGVRRFHKGPSQPLRDPKGRGRWGEDGSQDVIPSGDEDIWSLMHWGPGGIALGEATAIDVDDSEMMIGLYQGHDYT